MLRLLVLALVLANGLYFAWAQGLLREIGFAPAVQSEPQRLAQQLRPDALRILRPDEVRRLDAPAPVTPAPAVAVNPPECLQAGLFDASQADTLRGRLLLTLPAGSWLLEPVVEPARWIVYMGKYPTAQALAKKRSELASLNLKFEPLNNPALEYGVSLAAFQTQDAAVKALAGFTKRGVRTARVVQERPELRGSILKLAAADDSIKARLEEFKSALAGKPLRACK
jgi:hypothetical protein